jgi:hypothetical protein
MDAAFFLALRELNPRGKQAYKEEKAYHYAKTSDLALTRVVDM